MMMKKTIHYFLVALLVTAMLGLGACSKKTEKLPYTITCDETELMDGCERAYLTDLVLGVVDSADIVDGILCFKGEVDTAFFAMVTFDNNPWLGWYVYVEPGEMQLHDVMVFAEGTEINNDLELWMEELMEIYSEEGTIEYTTDVYWNENTNGIVRGFMVTTLMDVLPFAKLDTMISQLPPEVMNNRYIAKFLKEFEQRRSAQPGNKFADLPLTTLDGEAVKLSDYVGKGDVVLVDFWASWCGPCRRAIASMQALLPQHKNLKVLGVAVSDEAPDTRDAMEAMNITWPVICDTTNNAITTYGISGIPFLMLIDRDGTILATNISEEELETLLVEKGI